LLEFAVLSPYRDKKVVGCLMRFRAATSSLNQSVSISADSIWIRPKRSSDHPRTIKLTEHRMVFPWRLLISIVISASSILATQKKLRFPGPTNLFYFQVQN
jgi:hypothetical protein